MFLPVPDINKSVPSVPIVTLFEPNTIVDSASPMLIAPCILRFLGSVSGLAVPIVTSPLSMTRSLVTFKLPIACVSIRWAPVENVNSVNAT